MNEELTAFHACNVWDTGHSRHTGGETWRFMILRVVFILWDEKSWELLVLSSHFIVNFLNHVPQLECESIAIAGSWL